MAMEIENIDSNISKTMEQDEAKIEQLLSDKLMEGFVLLDKSCPVCSTPLVKKHEGEDEDPVEKEVEPVMIPRGSFTQPFKPIAGVPFCVACTSHVITQECEISVLENCNSLKMKGEILVALTGSEGTVTDNREQVPEKQLEIIDVTKIEETDSTYADEKKDAELVDETLTEYSVRREIATKVLGAKMLQGYSLMEKQCDKCGMPTMEYQGLVECVVCPALIKKAKKKLKAQKKLEKETVRLEREVNSAKFKKSSEERQLIESATAADQKRHESVVQREKERMELESRERALLTTREKEAEQARRMQIIENEKKRVAALETEQARLVQDAKSTAELEVKKEAAMASKAKEDETKLEEVRQAKYQSIEMDHAAATQKRKEVEAKIAEESKRLEAMEHRRKMGLATALESMNRDVLVAEHRKRLEAKAKLDLQIARLEHDIANEEAESKTINDEKRAEDEARMIELLEEEAASKAKAAEEAIRKAKAALEHVHSARREVIAQTIAMAEQEAIAEAESFIKKEREDYKSPVILPSASEIKRENWETLRTEGRSVMTRRVMAGWVLLAEFCEGVECHSSPLITKDGKKECVVCGGCGDGTDGAYIDVEDYDIVPTDDELRAMRESGVMPDDEEASGYEITPLGRPKAISPTVDHTFEELQQDFDTKRNMVSKEIGRRMIEGWTLLDASCPHCVMPLMMDTSGNSDICVLCGLVNTIQNNDGSTIKTADVPVKSVPVPAEPANQPKFETETETVTSEPETKVYTDDAETMLSTIPTINDTVKQAEESVKPSDESVEKTVSEDLPAVPTFDKISVDETKDSQDDLAESIRASAQRQQPVSVISRGDPPASLKPVNYSSKKKAMDPVSIDPPLSSKSIDSRKSSEEDDTVVEEITTNPRKSSEEDDADGEEIIYDFTAMIRGTPTGHEATLQPSLTREELEDLVDAYVATSLDPTVSEDEKRELAQDLKRKMTEEEPTPTGNSDGNGEDVIHLEDMPSPQNFKFDMVPSEEPEGHTTTASSSKKQPPAPETMTRPRARTNMPPRPTPSSPARASPRRPPRSTTSRSSPRTGSLVVTGGPSDMTSLGEMSRAESVATDALDSILDRIDAAKATLLRDGVSVKEQLEAANLIEKLAQAAVAVKALERVDY